MVITLISRVLCSYMLDYAPYIVFAAVHRVHLTGDIVLRCEIKLLEGQTAL